MGSLKNLIFRVGSQKKQYTGGIFCKRRTWTVCRFKKWVDRKKRAGVFEGVDTQMHVMGN